MDYGYLTLVAPILTLAVAIATRKVPLAMLVGIFTGQLLNRIVRLFRCKPLKSMTDAIILVYRTGATDRHHRFSVKIINLPVFCKQNIRIFFFFVYKTAMPWHQFVIRRRFPWPAFMIAVYTETGNRYSGNTFF